jgi:hypothetical protein
VLADLTNHRRIHGRKWFVIDRPINCFDIEIGFEEQCQLRSCHQQPWTRGTRTLLCAEMRQT